MTNKKTPPRPPPPTSSSTPPPPSTPHSEESCVGSIRDLVSSETASEDPEEGTLFIAILMVEVDGGVLVGINRSNRPPLTRADVKRKGYFPNPPTPLGSPEWWAAFRMALHTVRIVAALAGVEKLTTTLLMYPNEEGLSFAGRVAEVLASEADSLPEYTGAVNPTDPPTTSDAPSSDAPSSSPTPPSPLPSTATTSPALPLRPFKKKNPPFSV